MKKRLLCLTLVACLLAPLAALANDGAYLSGSDLHQIEPEYEAFLDTLADLLVQKGLLAESEREEWLLYQLGDFLQNGGYGTIVAMYTPGMLSYANESVTVRRFEIATAAGRLTLETLRKFSPQYSSLPGLPLDTELSDETRRLPLPLDDDGRHAADLGRQRNRGGRLYVYFRRSAAVLARRAHRRIR